MQKVLVVIDGDQGVSVDQCAEISRRLGAELEEKELFVNAYQLEVSSAGVDSPIELHRQYKKNVGRGLKVSLQDDTIAEGVLTEVTDTGIVLQLKKQKKEKEAQVLAVPFDGIKKTFVTVSFK